MTIGLSPVNIQSSVEKAVKDIREELVVRNALWKGVYRSEGNPTEEERVKYGALGPPERCIERIKELMEVPGLERIVLGMHSTDRMEQLEVSTRRLRRICSG